MGSPTAKFLWTESRVRAGSNRRCAVETKIFSGRRGSPSRLSRRRAHVVEARAALVASRLVALGDNGLTR